MRNPINSSRKRFLLNKLKTHLSNLNRSDDLNLIVQQLEIIGDADPTRSGKYCSWILDQVIARRLRLPEDSQKVREVLEVYDRIKGRLPVDLRDIRGVESYQALRATVREYLPKTLSRAERIMEGQELVYEDETYRILKVTSAETASKMAQNTGWCVCNENTAASYLQEGPLYFVMRDENEDEDPRFALVHEPSFQAMDFNDDPVVPKTFREISPDNPTWAYSQLVRIFRSLGLNELAHGCGGEPSFANITCEECGDPTGTCAYCIMHQCGICEKAHCPPCLKPCVECKGEFCESCMSKVNSELSYVCDSCKIECEVCPAITYPGQSSTCGQCEDALCSECLYSCDACGKYIGKDCMAKCRRCEKIFCRDCEMSCLNCNDFVCDECDICQGCGEVKHCISWCRTCSRDLCDQCMVVLCSICYRSHCNECIDIKCECGGSVCPERGRCMDCDCYHSV